jgi:hypothetical protein
MVQLPTPQNWKKNTGLNGEAPITTHTPLPTPQNLNASELILHIPTAKN